MCFFCSISIARAIYPVNQSEKTSAFSRSSALSLWHPKKVITLSSCNARVLGPPLKSVRACVRVCVWGGGTRRQKIVARLSAPGLLIFFSGVRTRDDDSFFPVGFSSPFRTHLHCHHTCIHTYKPANRAKCVCVCVCVCLCVAVPQVPEGPLAIRLARFNASGAGDVALRKDTDCVIS